MEVTWGRRNLHTPGARLPTQCSFSFGEQTSLEGKTVLASSQGTILRTSWNPMGPMFSVFLQNKGPTEGQDLTGKVAKQVAPDQMLQMPMGQASDVSEDKAKGNGEDCGKLKTSRPD